MGRLLCYGSFVVYPVIKQSQATLAFYVFRYDLADSSLWWQDLVSLKEQSRLLTCLPKTASKNPFQPAAPTNPFHPAQHPFHFKVKLYKLSTILFANLFSQILKVQTFNFILIQIKKK